MPSWALVSVWGSRPKLSTPVAGRSRTLGEVRRPLDVRDIVARTRPSPWSGNAKKGPRLRPARARRPGARTASGGREKAVPAVLRYRTSARPLSSTRVSRSPSGARMAPKSAPVAFTRAETPLAVFPPVKSQRLVRRCIRVDRQNVGPKLPRTAGHHKRGRPIGIIQHHLEPGRPYGFDVDLRQQRLRHKDQWRVLGKRCRRSQKQGNDGSLPGRKSVRFSVVRPRLYRSLGRRKSRS